MKFFGVVCVAAAAMLVSSCGKQNKGLTQAQSGRLTATLDSIGRAQGAGYQAQGASPVVDSLAASTTADQAQLRMAQRLRAGVCQFDTLPRNPGDIVLKVSGRDCPMEMSIVASLPPAGTLGKTSLNAEFKVKDAELKALNDVDEFALKGTLEAESKFAMIGSEPGQKVSAKLAMTGKAHSQKDGDIKLELSGGGNGEASNAGGNGHFEYVAKLVYSDFTAEFKRVQDISGGKLTDKFYLNGDEMTQQQFKDYLNRAGVAFAVLISESR